MRSILGMDRLQVWGGIECTVNRVGEFYRDQLLENGHAHRDDDLDHFAELGFDALRYPVLWERTACAGLDCIDWTWLDKRLNRLRELEVAPIAGLVHHGSGPRHTNLLDDGFATGLAQYAAVVAERFPWIEAYTPVNEPLTTARFSGLYGHWYPHQSNDEAFATALVNQCLGIALAMRAIRQANSDAKLVLTEDLGKTHSTPLLAKQAALENKRRWLSIDLLTGRVDRQHPLWGYIARTPQLETKLLSLVDEPCTPDILGFNYYLTSERLLDERLDRYPAWSHGGNSLHQYADVEAVRVRSEGIDGPELLLREAWERFGLPMAITEVHLCGHREEQVRWLLDSWSVAHELREHGIDLRAITLWSLLGSFDWNSLCTRKNGCYESGAFDVRGAKPRPTALARTVKQLAERTPVDTTAIPPVGWWRTDLRLNYPPVETGAAQRGSAIFRLQPQEAKRPLLIIGPSHPLGRAFISACKARRLEYYILSNELSDKSFVREFDLTTEEVNPWAIVNAALASEPVDRKSEFNLRTAAVKHLAQRCRAALWPLLAFSSDQVFDGSLGRPYIESDATSPLCDVGRNQCAVEEFLMASHSLCLIVRTSALFSPWDRQSYLATSLRRLAIGQTVTAADDWIVSPTYCPELVDACLDLLIDRETGLWHIVHRGEISWADLLRQAASAARLPRELICGRPGADLGLAAPSSRVTALASERGQLLPPLSDALGKYCRDAVGQWQEPEMPVCFDTIQKATS